MDLWGGEMKRISKAFKIQDVKGILDGDFTVKSIAKFSKKWVAS